MMEYLDYYDEQGNYLGYETRDVIHTKGLWHNTVHCWLYDKLGNIYFQIRKDTGTFYTTASGHVQKGETIKEAFKREIKEEIGINIDSSDAMLVNIVPWRMDKVKKDGTVHKDRAKAHVYIDEYEGDLQEFDFDPNEVTGLVKVNVVDTIELFQNKRDRIDATVITQKEDGMVITTNRDVTVSDFLVNLHETAYTKYGDILNKVMEVTKDFNFEVEV